MVNARREDPKEKVDVLVELGLGPRGLNIDDASNIAWRKFNIQGKNIELTSLC
jgi:hypothetical protein